MNFIMRILCIALCVSCFPSLHAADAYGLNSASSSSAPLINDQKAVAVHKVKLFTGTTDPFTAMLSKSTNEWDVQDKVLAGDLAWALENAPGSDKLFFLRKEILPDWQKWRSAGDKKHPAYLALIERTTKAIGAHKDVFSGASKAGFTLFVIAGNPLADMDFFRKKFIEAVVVAKESAYLFLLCSVLGYPRFDDKASRTLGGVDVSDKQALRHLFAMILAAYRCAYEQKYLLSIEEKLERLFSLKSSTPEERLACEQSLFLSGKLSENFSEYEKEWEKLRLEAQEEAHRLAGQELLNGLAKLKTATLFLCARLEALRVPDKAFLYPDERSASSDFLKDADFYSIMLGSLCRLTERCLYHESDTPQSSDYQAVLCAEYRDQKTKRLLSGLYRLPAGERPAKGVSSTSGMEIVKQRAVFEARLSILFGDLDFFDYPLAYSERLLKEFEQDKMADEARLYAAFVRLQAHINGQLWGFSAPQDKQAFMQQFSLLVRGLQAIAHGKDLQLGNPQKMQTSFAKLIVLSEGKKGEERKKITTNAPIFFAGQKKKAQSGVILSVEPKEVLNWYKLLWLFIATRATRLFIAFKASIERSAEMIEGEESDGEVFESDNGLEHAVNPRAVSAKKMSAMQAALARVTETAKSAGRRIEQAKRSIIKDDSLDGFIDGIDSTIHDARSLVKGMSAVTKAVSEELEKGYGRMQATLKALSVYVDSVVAFADKKIEGLQGTVRGFKDSMIKTLGSGVIKKQLYKAFTGKNTDDDLAMANIKRNMNNIMLATKGQLGAENIQGAA